MASEGQVRLNVPAPLRPLMHLVLADPALQARLGTIIQPEAYEAELCAIAAQHGMDMPDGILAPFFEPDPLGTRRFQTAPVEMLGGWPGAGWIPSYAILADAPMFDWSWFGDRRTNTPMFEDSVRRAGALPFNRMFRTQTGLDALIAGLAGAETVPLAGLVFHMSRCGSTLLARMLGAPPHHLVASEPDPFDAVIKWAETVDAPHDRKARALQAIVAALGRRRDPTWTRFFIKLDGWHILSQPLLRDAFPDVPWVFLHRDPVEVMVSLEAMPGLQSVPGILPDSLMRIENAYDIPQDEYGAKVLARFCEAAIESHAAGGGMMVDYAGLVPAALDAIPRHFGFTPDAEDSVAMLAASKVYSKNPSTKFVSDSAEKQSGADARMQELAAIHLADLRERLQRFATI